jgi:hypothetical protein
MQLPPKRRFGREWPAAAHGAAVYGGCFTPDRTARSPRRPEKGRCPVKLPIAEGGGRLLAEELAEMRPAEGCSHHRNRTADRRDFRAK